LGALVLVRIRQNVFLSPYVRMIAGGSCREGGGEAQVLGATGAQGGAGGGREDRASRLCGRVRDTYVVVRTLAPIPGRLISSLRTFDCRRQQSYSDDYVFDCQRRQSNSDEIRETERAPACQMLPWTQKRKKIY